MDTFSRNIGGWITHRNQSNIPIIEVNKLLLKCPNKNIFLDLI